MIVELFQSARFSVFETTYFGTLFMRSTISRSPPPAVGQNAAQICHVRRPSSKASADIDLAPVVDLVLVVLDAEGPRVASAPMLVEARRLDDAVERHERGHHQLHGVRLSVSR